MIGRKISVGLDLRSFVWLALLFPAACGGGTSAAVKDGSTTSTRDAGADVATSDDSGGTAADAIPTNCTTTRLVPGDQTSCRADFRCNDGATRSYVCGNVGGDARCFCIVGSAVATVPDGPAACGQGEQTLQAQASIACGWSVVDSLDGGSSPDGGGNVDGSGSLDGNDSQDADGQVDGGDHD